MLRFLLVFLRPFFADQRQERPFINFLTDPNAVWLKEEGEFFLLLFLACHTPGFNFLFTVRTILSVAHAQKVVD